MINHHQGEGDRPHCCPKTCYYDYDEEDLGDEDVIDCNPCNWMCWHKPDPGRDSCSTIYSSGDADDGNANLDDVCGNNVDGNDPIYH